MLKITNLHNRYSGKAYETLKGVDFEVNKGEVIAIVGKSGSGKTTLLRCISFLEKSCEGHMEFADMSIDMKKPAKKDILAARRRMGFVFQSFNLFSNMTVLDNVLEPLVTARGMDKSEANIRARQVLERVGMIDYLSRYPSEISGGQQQRVAIARAVAPSPEVILFDEATSALDPILTKEVLGVMRDLAMSGATMVLVTHELSFAREIASRVILMDKGRIVEEGNSREMFENPQTEIARDFFSFMDIKQ